MEERASQSGEAMDRSPGRADAMRVQNAPRRRTLLLRPTQNASESDRAQAALRAASSVLALAGHAMEPVLAGGFDLPQATGRPVGIHTANCLRPPARNARDAAQIPGAVKFAKSFRLVSSLRSLTPIPAIRNVRNQSLWMRCLDLDEWSQQT